MSQDAKLSGPICVVAHDAGAANIVLGLAKQYPYADLRFCLAGPAEKIFQAAFPGMANVDLAVGLKGTQTLLSGTSGESELEHHARQTARVSGIRSIAVIDHWVNYAERFVREGKTVLPDEIWVTDEYALAIAQANFSTPIQLVPNHYFANSLSQITPVERNSEELRLLYVLEPMKTNWGKTAESGEFQALNFFMENWPYIHQGKEWQIRLRPHPSEAPQKYEKWLSAHTDKRITIDDHSSLIESISWSTFVAGCESNAMVLGLLAGRRVLSTLPPWAHTCRLPHSDIVLMRELKCEVLQNLHPTKHSTE